jgi:hypothetical protein
MEGAYPSCQIKGLQERLKLAYESVLGGRQPREVREFGVVSSHPVKT